MATGEKRAKSDNFKGAEGKPFTPENQPTPEQKRQGWAKKKKGQELAKAVLELAFQGMKNSELKKAAAEYFKVPEDEITVEMMLLFRQAEKAIQKADTQAFKAVMERAHGQPKQDIDVTSEGKAIQAPIINVKPPSTSD